MLCDITGLSLSGSAEPECETHVMEEDITQHYFSACENGLDVGELIRLDDFLLRDSIAALEIMDPKMDNGVTDVLEADRVPYQCSKALLPSEVIAIMDQLFASEMTWHSGSSLSQTIYTCLYVQKILGKFLLVSKFSTPETGPEDSKNLLDKCLLPYVVATVKASDIIREEYLTGYLYEEEDVSSADFGLELLPMTDVTDTTLMLEEGIQWLGKHKVAVTCELSSELDQIQKRLSLRLQFLKLLQNLDEPKTWNTCVPQLVACFEGIQISSTKIEDLEDVFNTRIQRTLTSTSPPRPIISMPVSEAFANLKRAASDMLKILPASTPARESPCCMLTFFEYIRKTDPPMLALVRSRLQNLFLEDKLAQHAANKQKYLIDAIEEVCGTRSDLFDPKHAMVELPRDKRFMINKIVTDVLARLELPFFDYYKILCHNSGRQRRNLCKILTDFDVLQAEAEVADQELAALVGEKPKLLTNGHTSLSFTISSWLFNTKLDISLSILFMGFETDLYKPFEWSMIYWHLDNCLYLQNEHLYSIVVDRLPNHSPIRPHLAHRLLYNEALALLCKGYIRLTKALETVGVIQRPELKFSSPELLYNSRMTPFAKLISPPPVSYVAYAAESKRLDSDRPLDVLKDSSDHFNAARLKLSTLMKRGPSRLVARIPALTDDFNLEIKGLIGCCINNNLMLSKLLKEADLKWFKGRQLKWSESKFSKRFPSIHVE